MSERMKREGKENRDEYICEPKEGTHRNLFFELTKRRQRKREKEGEREKTQKQTRDHDHHLLLLLIVLIDIHVMHGIFIDQMK